MRFPPAALLSLILWVPPVFADLAQDIRGEWRYDGFFYDTHRYPNPNPRLTVLFTFNADHTARLFWRREDESGFCERKGSWSIRDDVLEQTVTWVNPANDSSCASDPDMQLGRTTANAIAVQGEELLLFMKLDVKDFIYILKRVVSN